MRPVRTDRRGVEGPTPGQARGPAWRRTSHGYYVPADVDAGRPEQRILEASVVVPDRYAITGWAALRWWTGSPWFAGRDAEGGTLPVTVVTATHGVRPQPGISISEECVHRADVTVVDGVPVIRPCAAVSFEVRRRCRDLVSAVICIDLACYTDVISLAEQAAYVEAQHGRTGVPRHREALGLADENCWSPQETRMRLRWVLDAELPRPRSNVPVFDGSGRHLGTPDLIDAVAGVVGEYDGAAHLTADRRLQDVGREELFRDHGLEYVTMMAGDTGFVPRLRRAYRRAESRRPGVGGRRWTVEPPAGWTSTASVADRRRLDEDQRVRFLRYRRAA